MSIRELELHRKPSCSLFRRELKRWYDVRFEVFMAVKIQGHLGCATVVLW